MLDFFLSMHAEALCNVRLMTNDCNAVAMYQILGVGTELTGASKLGLHSYINLKILGGHVPVCPLYEYGPVQWLRHPPKIFLVLSSNSVSNISFKSQLQHFSKEYSLITNSNFGAYVFRNWVEEGIKKKRQQINFVITYLLYSLHQMQLIFLE